MNPDLNGPLRKNPDKSPETYRHPSPSLQTFAASSRARCALCTKGVPCSATSSTGVPISFVHHKVPKTWWLKSKGRYHVWRRFDGEKFYMDSSQNLVVLCLDCHANITSAGLPFMPDMGEEKLNRQLNAFEGWVLDLPERLSRKAKLLLPQHMIWRAGEGWFDELRKKVRQWEDHHGRSIERAE